MLSSKNSFVYQIAEINGLILDGGTDGRGGKNMKI